MQSYGQDQYWQDYFDYRVAYYLLTTMIVAANSGNKDAYIDSRKELFSMKPKYYKNQHFKSILNKNYGMLKAIAIGRIIPQSYLLAQTICKLGIK